VPSDQTSRARDHSATTTSAADTDQSADRPVALNDGYALPRIGLGTFGFTGPDGVEVITAALRGGYRLIDTVSDHEIPQVGGVRDHVIPHPAIT
jgi:hypothetical protein